MSFLNAVIDLPNNDQIIDVEITIPFNCGFQLWLSIANLANLTALTEDKIAKQ